jgi:hypothetical protein
MKKQKLLLFLWIIFGMSMFFWIFGTPSLIAEWYSKNGTATLVSRTGPLDEYRLLSMWTEDIVFHIVPSFCSAYCIIGLMALDLIVKLKSENKKK